MRRAARVDHNHAEIVAALRAVGATVESLAAVGSGCPDALVGYRGINVLLEIKNPNVDRSHRQLTTHEQRWHQDWRGSVVVVMTVDEALRAIGVLAEARAEGGSQ